MRSVLPMLVVGASCLFAWQDQPVEGARQLYYLAKSARDSLPPVAPPAASAPAPPAGAVHLGLRYNLVLLDSSGRPQPISADRILHAGDCFAIDIQSNRSGYLYVFAKQSSGSWRPLLPSPEMPEASNVLDPGRKVQIPNGYCFAVENPPGQETMFVVLSRDPRDFYELYESFKAKSSAPAPVQMANAAKLNSAIEHIEQRFGTRDITITRTHEPQDEKEPPGSVYVVNTSGRPASSIVTKIMIRHD